jgi:hypothetical protein
MVMVMVMVMVVVVVTAYLEVRFLSRKQPIREWRPATMLYGLLCSVYLVCV